MKDISLGESEVVNVVVAVLGLATCMGVALFILRATQFQSRLAPPLHFLLAFAIGGCAAYPFGLIRRRFGCARLALVGSDLRFYPYGSFWFARTLPSSTIQSIHERRRSDDENLGPSWTLVVERSNGSRVELGNFRNERIHEIVAQLNAFVRGNRARIE